MIFHNHITQLNIQRDAVSSQDFLSVYHAVTGRVIPVKGRTDFLIEYRFNQDKDTGEWIGSKEKIYEQLKRNYGFDETRYPNYDALSKMAKDPTPTFIPAISPRAKAKPLIYENNPYKTKENAMETTTPAAEIPFKAMGKAEETAETTKDSPAMAAVKRFIDSRRTIVKKSDPAEEIKTADNPSKKDNKRHTYTLEEDLLIFSRKLPDKEIAKKLGISYSRVQHRRSELKEREIESEDELIEYYETFSSNKSRKNVHRYTFGEDNLILFSDIPEEKLAKKIGITIRLLRRHKVIMKKEHNIHTVEELEKYHQSKPCLKDTKTASKEATRKAENKPDNKAETKAKEPKKAENGSKANGLIDRMMDLMSDFEAFVRENEGKDKDAEAKKRYEYLLQVLIAKDLQFFALTAGDNKIAAQDNYLKAAGFTEDEIAYFRGKQEG